MGAGIDINWRPLPVISEDDELDGCTHWIRLSNSQRPPPLSDERAIMANVELLYNTMPLMALTIHPSLDGGAMEKSRPALPLLLFLPESK